MDVRGTISAPSAAVDWIDVLGVGQFAEGLSGELIVRCSEDTRIAVGVPDPGTSETAGSSVKAKHATKIILGSDVTNQSVWVQVPADQSPINVEVDDQSIDVVFPAGSMLATENPLYNHGFEDYNATNVALTPAADVRTKVLNNGLGAFTNKAYKIPGRGDIWDTVNNRFDWSNAGLQLGDTILLRLDFNVTTNSSNNGIEVELDLAVGSGAPYSLHIGSQDWRYPETHQFIVLAEIYMGDTNTLNYPCEIYVKSDTGGESITYNGHYVKYSLMTPSAT